MAAIDFRKRSRWWGVLLGGVLWTVGCNGGTPTPVSPAPAPPTAESLTITSGTGAIRTGFFADYTLTASMSDHTTQNVTRQAVWTTSDSGVATVDANGRLTAVSNGTVSLNATYQGRSASRPIRVVYNYSGQWNGTYMMRTCDQTGVFASSRYCQNLGPTAFPFALQITQSGDALDVVSGLISLRGLVGPVSGAISGDGRLTLSASYVAVDSGVNMRVEISSWSTTPSASLPMAGSFVQTLVVIGSEGSAIQTNEIVSAVQKSDTALASDLRPGGDGAQVLFEVLHDIRPFVTAHGGDAVCRQPRPERVVGRDPRDRTRQPGCVAGLDQQPGFTVYDQIRHAADA